MAADVEFGDASLEASRLRLRECNALVTFNANTTPANIVIYSDVTAIKMYAETSGQPTPVDSGANFGTLDSNAAPTTVGLLVLTGQTVATGNALRVVDIFVPTTGIQSAAMTAGVVTLAGASTTGVTASGNIAAVISCTGLDGDANTNTTTFNVIVRYICTPQNVS